MNKTKEPSVEDLEQIIFNEGEIFEKKVWVIRKTSVRHHPTQPAVQYKDGDWFWAWVDQPHRWDGPALFCTGEYQYWIMGKRLSKDEWETHPGRLEWIRNQTKRL